MTNHHRCWAEISRDAFRHNARVVRERIGEAQLLAVVKANAYGHGLMGVAETLAEQAQLFGVANLEEAIELRERFHLPVIILGPSLREEMPTIVERAFIPTVSTFDEAQAFDRIGKTSINFKVDTGMGRMGAVEAEAVETFKRVAALKNIEIHSVSTHMPVSDVDPAYTKDQLVRFRDVVKQLRENVPGGYKAHVLQSAGTLGFNETVDEIVRAGIVLYGISPLPEYQKLLKPAMTWKTRIGLIRNVPKGHSISYGRTFVTPKAMRVATLTAGYADGYPRHLSNVDAQMLVRGQRCPLLGRVTMDLMVIDVSNLPDVELGDEVVLIGKQGDAEIPCRELSDKAGTITWDITTRIGQRVKRVFV